MKNTQSKIKPIKIGKQSGRTNCFEHKDYTKNFRPEEVKMMNKVLREKSHCVLCQSNKSRFLKLKTKLIINVMNKNKMKTCVRCRKGTENIDPKQLEQKIIDQ